MCIDGAEGHPCVCTEGIYSFSQGRCADCPPNCQECLEVDECVVCDPGYYLLYSGECAPCAPECAHCNGDTLHDCIQCAENQFLFPHTSTCTSYCPTGFNKLKNECEEAIFSVDFVFDNKQFEIEAGGVQVVSGAQLGMADNSDPLPMYQKGLYFDGNDMMVLDGLVFNVKFTLGMWIRILSDGTLFELSPTSFF